MTTNNQVDVGLSGTTGSVHFVGSTSPSFVTPTLGVATGTSIAFSPTTGGIVGTTTNDNAGSGTVGEYVSSQVLFANAVSFSNGISKDITSISLAHGDWDVYGSIFITYDTTSVAAFGWINTTSATPPDGSLLCGPFFASASIAAFGFQVFPIRVSISSTTTVYLSAQSSFSAGTSTGCGMIWARRVR